MLKFLYFTDSHFSEQKPKYRIDKDFVETQINKLNQIMEITIEKAVNAVIIGGDLFNNTQPTLNILGKIGAALNINGHYWQGDTLSIMGNHDLIGYNHDSVYDSGLGVLDRHGILDILSLESASGYAIPKSDCRIFSINYRKKQDLERYKLKNKPETAIIVSHDMITPSTMKYESLLIKDVAQVTNADIILCSHFHGSFCEKVKDTWFVNPGALIRRTITEIDNTPQVALISIDKKIDIKFIKLKVEDGDKIFNIEMANKAKDKKIDLEGFVNLLKETKIKDTDIDKHIDKLGIKLRISKDIIDLAKERVQRARISLGSD